MCVYVHVQYPILMKTNIVKKVLRMGKLKFLNRGIPKG